jgi:hypothetical protein
MKTFQRICIQDFVMTAENGDCLNLKRGKEYITSEEENGFVTVFMNYWVKVPINIFARGVVFSK